MPNTAFPCHMLVNYTPCFIPYMSTTLPSLSIHWSAVYLVSVLARQLHCLPLPYIDSLYSLSYSSYIKYTASPDPLYSLSQSFHAKYIVSHYHTLICCIPCLGPYMPNTLPPPVIHWFTVFRLPLLTYHICYLLVTPDTLATLYLVWLFPCGIYPAFAVSSPDCYHVVYTASLLYSLSLSSHYSLSLSSHSRYTSCCILYDCLRTPDTLSELYILWFSYMLNILPMLYPSSLPLCWIHCLFTVITISDFAFLLLCLCCIY